MTRKQFHAALDELRPRVLATEPTSKARKLNRETRRWLRNCAEEGGWRPEATEGMLAGLRRVILTEIGAGLGARDFHGFAERVAELHQPVARTVALHAQYADGNSPDLLPGWVDGTVNDWAELTKRRITTPEAAEAWWMERYSEPDSTGAICAECREPIHASEMEEPVEASDGAWFHKRCWDTK